MTTVVCTCAACRVRRLRGPLLLIALGAVWLLHTTGVWEGPTAAGAWLIAAGMAGLAIGVAPSAPAHPRPSLFGPLFVAASGAALVAHVYLPRLGPWLARYWPLILIAWGVTRLLEHLLARQSAVPVRKPGLNAGDIFLILLIVLGGLAVGQWYRMQPLLDQYGARTDLQRAWPGFHWPGGYRFSRHSSQGLSPGDRVVVRSAHGDVTITASADAQVDAEADYEIQAPNSAAARATYNGAPLELQREGDAWVVQPAGESNDAGVRADLRLSLPATTALEIDSDEGDVTVTGWSGPLTLGARRGDLTVTGAGALAVTTAHGDVTLREIDGALRLDGAGGDLTIDNVRGGVTVQGNFSGDINLRDLAGPLQFGSSRLQLAAAAVPGDITFDLDSLTAKRVEDLTLHTRNQEINATGLNGSAQVESAGKDVHLAFATPPRGAVTATSSNADVSLAMPADSAFQLTAHAERGEITGDFGLQAVRQGSTSDAHLSIGEAPAATIRLTTTNGSITLSRHWNQ